MYQVQVLHISIAEIRASQSQRASQAELPVPHFQWYPSMNDAFPATILRSKYIQLYYFQLCYISHVQVCIANDTSQISQ